MTLFSLEEFVHEENSQSWQASVILICLNKRGIIICTHEKSNLGL